MIPVSDLRKGNLIKTEHGICPVHHIVFSDVYVLGKDNRVNFAREVEGVDALSMDFDDRREIAILLESILKNNYPAPAKILFMHEIQNLWYWVTRRELRIKRFDDADMISKLVNFPSLPLMYYSPKLPLRPDPNE